MNYDLEERTARFGEEVIGLCRMVKQDVINRPIINQLVRSSTSVGANYLEANGASSKKDFRNKIFICKKEVQETKHWLRMLSGCIDEKERDLLIKIIKECGELVLIFGKIAGSTKLI